MHFLIIVDTSTRAREAMLGAKGLQSSIVAGPSMPDGHGRLVQMFQSEQRRGSRPILAQRDVGELRRSVSDTQPCGFLFLFRNANTQSISAFSRRD